MNRKNTILALVILAICYAAGFSQSVNRITQRCPAPNNTRFATVNISAVGDVLGDPCPDKTTGITGELKGYDPTYVSPIFGSATTTRLSVGSTTSQTIPVSENFVGVDIYNKITPTNSVGKQVASVSNILTLDGAPTGASAYYGIFNTIASTWSGATPVANYTGLFSSVDAAGTGISDITGVNGTGRIGSVNVGTVTNLYGVRGIAAYGYASTITNVHGVQGLIQGASDFGGTTTNVRAVHATRVGIASNATNFCGVCIGNYSGVVTGVITNNYALHIDSTVDQGTNRWAIFSQSVAPSVLAGDVAISDTTKGIVLKSPDGTCYRFTVANGGALSAGAAITCP